jgi:hypothetical protein
MSGIIIPERKIVIPPTVGDNAFYVIREASRLNLWYFVKHFCITEDPHDHINPEKNFPDKEYLRVVCEVWSSVTGAGRWRYPILLIPKSRQMLITWLMLACHLWLAMTRSSQRIYIQAQKQEDANELLERFMFIYWHLHPAFRATVKCIKSLTEKTHFSNRSQVLALAKGGSQIRQKTASAIMSDEAAFQEELDKTHRAAKPTIVGGGRITYISSAEEGYMKQMVLDELHMLEGAAV